MDSKDLLRMGDALADVTIKRNQERLEEGVRRIIIDLDVTDDPTHGNQQLTFFNGYYDTYCYLPLYFLKSIFVFSKIVPTNTENFLLQSRHRNFFTDSF